MGVSLFFIICCRELGIGIVAYSPLGRGFFAGYTPEDNTVQDRRQVTLQKSCFYITNVYLKLREVGQKK